MSHEHQLSARWAALLGAAAATGWITLPLPEAGVWQQWTYLAHTLLGLGLALSLAGYLAAHLRRTLGLRRPLPSLLGILSVLAVLAVAGTGLHIAFLGQREADRWVYSAHLGAGAGILAPLAGHVWSARRRGAADPAQPGHSWRHAGQVTAHYAAVTAVAIALATFGYSLLPTPYRDAAAVTPYLLSYGEHPFRPSQTETASGSFMDPRRVGDSRRCGACHAQIAREWQASMHAQAAADQAYQTNVKLLSKKKGMPTTRYCEGCHAPVALLSGQLSEGGKLDTPGHLLEGVSCLTCHGADHIVHTKGVASYRFAPAQPYLFEGYGNGLAVRLHDFLVRIQPRQHRRDMARPPLATPELCASCHVQFMDRDVNNWGWVQMQDEYTAWLASPFSRQARQSFSETAMKRCQDCHFPLVAGEDPSADAAGRLRSHRAPGANTAIPWFTGDLAQLDEVRRFLRADQVRVSLDIPDRPGAPRSQQHVAPGAAQPWEPPDYVYLGEVLEFTATVANAQVGHNFPGGTTDINEAWLHVRLADAQDRTVYESGGVGDDGAVDGAAYFYKSVPIDRQGEPVWRHDLFNMVGDSFKRVIPAGKADTVAYRARIPGWAKGPLMVSATLKYRKLNLRYARWALDDPGLSLPIVDLAADSLSVPVRIKPEALPE